jgi:hypothetical protein
MRGILMTIVGNDSIDTTSGTANQVPKQPLKAWIKISPSSIVIYIGTTPSSHYLSK